MTVMSVHKPNYYPVNYHCHWWYRLLCALWTSSNKDMGAKNLKDKRILYVRVLRMLMRTLSCFSHMIMA